MSPGIWDSQLRLQEFGAEALAAALLWAPARLGGAGPAAAGGSRGGRSGGGGEAQQRERCDARGGTLAVGGRGQLREIGSGKG